MHGTGCHWVPELDGVRGHDARDDDGDRVCPRRLCGPASPRGLTWPPGPVAPLRADGHGPH